MIESRCRGWGRCVMIESGVYCGLKLLIIIASGEAGVEV